MSNLWSLILVELPPSKAEYAFCCNASALRAATFLLRWSFIVSAAASKLFRHTKHFTGYKGVNRTGLGPTEPPVHSMVTFCALRERQLRWYG
jgi:hypothetical protein